MTTKIKIYILTIFCLSFSFELQSAGWAQKQNFGGSSRMFAVSFSIGSKGYIGTGMGASGLLYQDFWEWDQTNNTWTKKADFSGEGENEMIIFYLNDLINF